MQHQRPVCMHCTRHLLFKEQGLALTLPYGRPKIPLGRRDVQIARIVKRCDGSRIDQCPAQSDTFCMLAPGAILDRQNVE